jgi:hypothetical protein
MCAAFAEYCRAELESRQIELFQGDCRHFLDTQVPAISGRFEVSVTATILAPLNMIDDLCELFAEFHALTYRFCNSRDGDPMRLRAATSQVAMQTSIFRQ